MENGISYRRSLHSRRRLRVFLGALILLPPVILVYLSINLRPVMAAQAEARIQTLCTKAMNDAISITMQSSSAYDDLVKVKENGEHVYLLQANAQGMNLLASGCADAAQDEISQLGKQGIAISLGTITGVPFFSGKGPYIRVSFTPVGSVQSSFQSEFVAAGINQTLYRVKLNLNSSIKLILPGVTETVNVGTEAAICESILVGAVPEVYTNVEDTEDMLNLVPTELP